MKEKQQTPSQPKAAQQKVGQPKTELHETEQQLPALNRRLHTALLQCMAKRDYQKITVSQLCDTAAISRQTFYQHFSNRDALLCDYVDTMFDAFYDDIAVSIQQHKLPGMDISRHLFQQWYEQQAFARLVFRAGAESLLISRFRSYISRVMGLYIRHHNIPVTDPERLAYMTDYLAGASWMVLQRWAEQDFAYSRPALAALFTQLTQPGFMEALLQPSDAHA